MKYIFLVLLVFANNSFAASSEESLQKVRDVLLKHKEVEGDFKQTRTVKDLKLKLQSEGKFQFKLPLDLTWNQKKPFAMDLLMTSDKIVQKNADGSEQTITKAQQPVIFIFSSSFLAVFSGDKKEIEKNFKYEVLFKGAKWSMTLEPKDEMLQKAIKDVKIAGADFVENVEIHEKSGGATVIVFSNIKGK